MIYPKGIQDFILSNQTYKNRFYEALNPDVLNVGFDRRTEDVSLESWLKVLAKRKNDSVSQYIDFIVEMKDIFQAVRASMSYMNSSASHLHGDDAFAAGWSGIGMMPIALYLYYLHSYGVQGAVLECGCFKGGSSICLSWVCNRLGLKLYVADSFEGLPDSDNEYYNKGSFAASLEEVRSNIETFGKIENVEFIKGFYSESLKGFNEKLMLIWLDVDLRTSVLDAMQYAYPNLVDNGVIFCDGLGEKRDFAGEQLRPAGGESQGLIEYFANHNIKYKAKYAGYGHLGLIVPNCPDDGYILYEPEKERIMTSGIENELHDLRCQIEQQRTRNLELVNSTSWKITAPLRKIVSFLKFR